MKRRTKVYVAGRMTNGKGDGYDVISIRTAILVHNSLVEKGFAPFCPQLTLFAEVIQPVEYEKWLGMDFEWVQVCDVLLRLPGESKGADQEVEYAKSRGIPVVYSVEELLANFAPDVQAPQYVPGEV